MRKPPMLVALALGALAAFVALVPRDTALSQAPGRASLSVEARLSSLEAGTTAAPRPARLRLEAHLRTPLGAEKPVVIGATALLPKGISYNGGEYPTCTWRALELEGPSSCPKRSIVGSGTGLVDADGTSSHLRMKLVNGGPSRVYAYVTLAGPAKVSATVPVEIERLRHRKWQYRLTVTMPRSLQSVSGVPIALQDLELDMGKGAKGTKHASSWLTSTSCPTSGRRLFVVTALLEHGAGARRRGALLCR
jgi:hypothetical protein